MPGLGRGCGHYLLKAAAPHAVLPAPIRALGRQAGCAVGEEVTGRGAGQRRRRLHRHGRHVQQGVAEAGPVIGGLHRQDPARLPWGRPGAGEQSQASPLTPSSPGPTQAHPSS